MSSEKIEANNFVTIFLDGLIKRPAPENDTHVYCDWCDAKVVPNTDGWAIGFSLPDGWKMIERPDSPHSIMCPACVESEIHE